MTYPSTAAVTEEWVIYPLLSGRLKAVSGVIPPSSGSVYTDENASCFILRGMLPPS